jgi:hypothetical protein
MSSLVNFVLFAQHFDMYPLSTAQQTLISSTIMMGPNLSHLLFSIISSKITHATINNGARISTQTKLSKLILGKTTQLSKRRILAFVGVPHLIQPPALTRKTTGRL